RDTRTRLRDIGEARIAIEKWLANPVRSEAAAADIASKTGPSRFWPALSTVVLVAFAALAFVHFRQKAPIVETSRFEVAPPQNGQFTCCLSLSPDGRKIAFTAQQGADPTPKLWVRGLDSFEVRIVHPNLIGPVAPHPFWSPDSRFIAFGSLGKIK